MGLLAHGKMPAHPNQCRQIWLAERLSNSERVSSHLPILTILTILTILLWMTASGKPDL